MAKKSVLKQLKYTKKEVLNCAWCGKWINKALNIENNYGPYLIISLATALVMMLINLFIGLISKTQVSAQVISLPVTMISMFIPMLSEISKDFDNVTKYSYMGLFSKSISQLESFKWQDQIASSLSLLAWLLLFATLTILQSKRLRKIS